MCSWCSCRIIFVPILSISGASGWWPRDGNSLQDGQGKRLESCCWFICLFRSFVRTLLNMSLIFAASYNFLCVNCKVSCMLWTIISLLRSRPPSGCCGLPNSATNIITYEFFFLIREVQIKKFCLLKCCVKLKSWQIVAFYQQVEPELHFVASPSAPAPAEKGQLRRT